jgi:predicted  nucleic acid-binding Zn-ribbon protein
MSVEIFQIQDRTYMRDTKMKAALLTTTIVIAAQMISVAHAENSVPAASETLASQEQGSAPSLVAAPSAASAPLFEGTVAQLARRTGEGKITSLRSTAAGDYRAELSFFADGLTYYVALVQNGTYWRVIETPNKKRAETVYAEFVARTVGLSEAQHRQTELEAANAATQRSLVQAQLRMQQLQADFDIAQAQQDEVSTRQTQIAAQVTKLQSDNQDAQNKLVQVKRQVVALQDLSDAGLPPEHLARSRRHTKHVKTVVGAASRVQSGDTAAGA